MVDIDLRALGPYGPVFTSWFAPTLLLANFIYVRSKTSLSFFKVVCADVAMTALSWVLIAGVPIVPFVIWGVVLTVIGHGPVAGLVPVFIVSALIVAICEAALLRGFKHKVTNPEFCLLAAINLFNLVLAFYRMYIFTLAHPPAD